MRGRIFYTMTFAVVTGIALTNLLAAIAQVESDRGATSRNVYQLTPEYVADVNRIQRKLTRIDGVRRTQWKCEDVLDVTRSEEMIAVYWAYYGKRLPQGGTAEELAKMHNVGYSGLRTRKTAAKRYWARVEKHLMHTRRKKK